MEFNAKTDGLARSPWNVSTPTQNSPQRLPFRFRRLDHQMQVDATKQLFVQLSFTLIDLRRVSDHPG